jgi:hypothetical protein
LSPGAGNVIVDSNLIQGNLGGAADGGGLALRFVNGEDVLAAPTDPSAWYRIAILNNMIVNNVTGLAGGGISLQDADRVTIAHNTIANNDSAATAADAFGGDPNQSVPQVAGIVSRAHSEGLEAATGRSFSQPELLNDIIWQNRSFYWQAGNPPALLENAAGLYQDLGVAGVAGALAPQFCVLTSTVGYAANNTSADPGFADPYFNALQTAAAADEGGNFIQILFSPLSPGGDYHIGAGSSALDAGTAAVLAANPELADDFDQDARPDGDCPDIGADEAAGLGGTVPGGCGVPLSPPAPVAVAEAFNDTSLEGFVRAAPGVLANDVHAAGTTLTASLVPGSVSVGKVALASNGGFTFTPPSAAWVGTAQFRYVASDGFRSSEPATVTIRKEMAVTYASFDRSERRWQIRGNSTAPAGTVVTVRRGGAFTGVVIGATRVFRNATGQRRFNLDARGPAVPVAGAATTISVGGSSGKRLFSVPFRNVP